MLFSRPRWPVLLPVLRLNRTRKPTLRLIRKHRPVLTKPVLSQPSRKRRMLRPKATKGPGLSQPTHRQKRAKAAEAQHEKQASADPACAQPAEQEKKVSHAEIQEDERARAEPAIVQAEQQKRVSAAEAQHEKQASADRACAEPAKQEKEVSHSEIQEDERARAEPAAAQAEQEKKVSAAEVPVVAPPASGTRARTWPGPEPPELSSPMVGSGEASDSSETDNEHVVLGDGKQKVRW